MNDLEAALERIKTHDPFLLPGKDETPDDVFAPTDDRYRRHNSDWWRALAADRESKEGSP